MFINNLTNPGYVARLMIENQSIPKKTELSGVYTVYTIQYIHTFKVKKTFIQYALGTQYCRCTGSQALGRLTRWSSDSRCHVLAVFLIPVVSGIFSNLKFQYSNLWGPRWFQFRKKLEVKIVLGLSLFYILSPISAVSSINGLQIMMQSIC